MQLNYKSIRLARGRKDLDTAGITQAEYIARQLQLEKMIDGQRKRGERPGPTIRKFSWES
jgi:hypothetical protein